MQPQLIVEVKPKKKRRLRSLSHDRRSMSTTDPGIGFDYCLISGLVRRLLVAICFSKLLRFNGKR